MECYLWVIVGKWAHDLAMPQIILYEQRPLCLKIQLYTVFLKQTQDTRLLQWMSPNI